MSCDIFVKIKRKDIDFAPPTALVATALLGAAPLVATNPASLVAMVAAITLLQLEAHHPASTINTPAPPVALHPYRSTNVDPTPLKYLRSLPCLTPHISPWVEVFPPRAAGPVIGFVPHRERTPRVMVSISSTPLVVVTAAPVP
ncbi:hypothetical protein V6N11_059866 [Hibiscus sabdariffa]|uniref:Uncharacterized protein n=1 Tax=Hibiscus sabdariffa TaxID=183260 RepID=A0ABR2NYJ1_9ROSI